MFETYSFEAFNTFSLANLKCSLKYNSSNIAFSLVSLEYYFGLSEKYQLTVRDDSLTYDMKFVIGNIKGFYDYLRSIHEDNKFKFC